MKFLIFFALAFAGVTPKDLHSRLIEVPMLENEGRIVNGRIADPEEFKYMVSVSTVFHVGTNVGWCGGSLIGDKWVLTAAHCVNAARLVRVYLGSTVRLCPEKFHDVLERDIFVHPLYHVGLKVNDISLIKIPSTSESSRIGYVRIPDNPIDKYLNKTVVVTGWGVTSDNGTGPVDDLHFAILKVSPGEICLRHYGHVFSDDAGICVATPDRVSTCRGDSGSPLVVEEENLQIGVNAAGSTSCVNKDPIVFTRVSAYIIWILARTGIGL